ncbi:sulfatase-like hydrolase/transferase [Paenibacillus sp. HJL G12]|uniref:Sulfatase-like hydrolase/transferase n=1 Tax=Paenibacillus dendrobii TaxID=2691084 RepID=A0A7X3IPG1_9BACL|nr:sulfatase-like hydrolase/transferase [Paenibacillus dendrobii]MWV47026.1 sulfatase-like hydrolase/transferase [Paenibacillus dendrobii]
MSNKKHIWLITTDQMRADAQGFENAAVITPHLDALADEGTVFNRAYCASPVCTPSRASIFTGRYPHVHRAWNIGLSLSEEDQTLCDHLKQSGYRTVGVGKMHFRQQLKTGFVYEAEEVSVRDRGRERDGTYYGFDEHHISEDNMIGEYVDDLAERSPEAAARLKKDLYRSEDAEEDVWESALSPELHQSRWIADKSIRAIEEHSPEGPLFLWSSFVDPHHPFNPPEEYAKRYEKTDIPDPCGDHGDILGRPEHLRLQKSNGYWPGGGEPHSRDREHMKRLTRNYYAMITFIDEEIGRIRHAWKEKGMDDELIVVFTSDHGELLGDHGLLYKGPWFYEGLTRIPMIVRGPGVRQGAVTDALMEHVDIVPTLLELIGRPDMPEGIQGVSQQPVAAGHAERIRSSAMTSYDAHDRGVHAKCLRTDKYKLVIFADEAYGELFDLEADPKERHNLFSDPSHLEIKQRLMEIFIHRLMQDQDPLPVRRAFW